MEYDSGSGISKKEVDRHGKRRRTTKKGIIITAVIVIAVVGASFIVYLIP